MIKSFSRLYIKKTVKNSLYYVHTNNSNIIIDDTSLEHGFEFIVYGEPLPLARHRSTKFGIAYIYGYIYYKYQNNVYSRIFNIITNIY